MRKASNEPPYETGPFSTKTQQRYRILVNEISHMDLSLSKLQGWSR